MVQKFEQETFLFFKTNKNNHFTGFYKLVKRFMNKTDLVFKLVNKESFINHSNAKI